MAYIQEQVANALGFPVSQLDVQQLLNYVGLDSLMAVELRNQIRAELGVEIPVVNFLKDITVTTLVTQIMEQMYPIPKGHAEGKIREGLMPTKETHQTVVMSPGGNEKAIHQEFTTSHEKKWIEGTL